MNLTSLTRMERKFAGAALEAFAPRMPGLRTPIDYAGALTQVMRASTRKAAMGMRLGLWIVVLAPMWLGGGLKTIATLSLERRSRVLSRLLSHENFVVRELVTLLKVVASFALLANAQVREQSHYDRPAITEFSLPVVEAV